MSYFAESSSPFSSRPKPGDRSESIKASEQPQQHVLGEQPEIRFRFVLFAHPVRIARISHCPSVQYSLLYYYLQKVSRSLSWFRKHRNFLVVISHFLHRLSFASRPLMVCLRGTRRSSHCSQRLQRCAIRQPLPYSYGLGEVHGYACTTHAVG